MGCNDGHIQSLFGECVTSNVISKCVTKKMMQANTITLHIWCKYKFCAQVIQSYILSITQNHTLFRLTVI